MGWDYHLFNTLVLPIVPWLLNIVTWVAVESIIKNMSHLLGIYQSFLGLMQVITYALVLENEFEHELTFVSLTWPQFK